MEIPCRLRNVEEIISEMDLFYVADDILECDEDYQIVISGWWVHIPELGINLPKTHEIISRELKKIPNLKVREHMAGGYGIIAELQGKKAQGKNILLRADIDALPLEEQVDCDYKSTHPGKMHACGHDGHATWLIGAAKILARLTGEFGGCLLSS